MEEKNVEQQAGEGTPEAKNKLLLYVNDNMPELAEFSEDDKYSAIVELLQANRSFNEKMEELFKSEPMIGELLGGVMQGKKSLLGSMAEIMTPEEYAEALNSEGGDVMKSRKERLEKLKSYEDKQSLVEKNVAETEKNVEAWIDKKGWAPEKVQDFSEKIGKLFDIMADGVLTEAELDMLEHMIYYDDAVASAREEGELLGRNAKIDTSRLEQEAATATDGLPEITGSGAAPAEAKPQGYFDDAINQATTRQQRLRG